MSFKNDIDALFREVSGQRKWYKGLDLTAVQAAVLKNRNGKGQLSIKARAKMLEKLSYRFIIYEEGMKLSLEDQINVIFGDIASQRMWHDKLEINPRQAAMVKFMFSTDQLSLDAQIEILENIGYSIHITRALQPIGYSTI